ncbi:DUF4446 family protein [Clostridium felsineum]|uniref:Uncharacterized protein n=1 Tax=Clostridium felsineum TaxID=36839 RepID=A0A1S8LY78_9CLOT|nr:DUF4446 family protein [Clostridium felsineum]MCR3761131.1 DUF4446 family protein [Clostridium felsineum]URZ02787.1 hypothetical protein CLAUR_028200 [Clostridium felsineum]URZ08887.1 hypothetical protein CLROS_042820 [Clostridium felsineum]URZ09515.1 hypothetical protein CROST_001870 [Clostridium felsineum]
MEDIFTLLNQFNVYITIGLCILVFVLIILNISSLHSTKKLKKNYKKLMRGTSSENLEELINGYLNKVEQISEDAKEVKDIYGGIQAQVKTCIKNVAMVRYKAFDNVGSDLSFSLVMLDDNYDGIIITSIYGRGESVVYAKPINKGLSRYDLSDEEKNILKEVCEKEKDNDK